MCWIQGQCGHFHGFSEPAIDRRKAAVEFVTVLPVEVIEESVEIEVVDSAR